MKYPQLVSMPSAVSDWFAQQLEARGIDAVVYTRYVLSLFNRDPVDVFYSDDLQVTNLDKEVTRPKRNRKRFRQNTDWWDHSEVDADKLKRTAAVECLMSASDQKCGIESLVDELCEKLKEAKTNSTSRPEKSHLNSSADVYSLSPQDLAKQYYAAFPPLIKDVQKSSNITFIPRWFASPKEKIQKQNWLSNESNFYTNEADVYRYKVNKKKVNPLKRGKKPFGYSQNINKSNKHPDKMTDWNLYMFNTNQNFTSDAIPQTVISANNPSVKSLNDGNSTCDNSSETLNIYDDLPFDIRELLNSPTPQEETVKRMNVANNQDSGIQKFINNGTNIKSSIWSNNFGIECNPSNMYSSFKESEPLLGIRFSSLSLENNNTETVWPSMENTENTLLNSCNTDSIEDFYFGNSEMNEWDITPSLKRWSDVDCVDDELELAQVQLSLEKLEHNKNESAFAEVYPRTRNPLSKMFNYTSSSIQMNIRTQNMNIANPAYEKEDLLTSDRTHFYPINEKNDLHLRKYIDGTTFIVSNNLDKIEYKRSESGYLFLNDEYGLPNKYSEFGKSMNENDFVTKFKIVQNDKVCQADIDGSYDVINLSGDNAKENLLVPSDNELIKNNFEIITECLCPIENINAELSFNNCLSNCPLHKIRSDSVTEEIFRNFQTKCDECKSNPSCQTNWQKDKVPNQFYESKLDDNIWNGGDICTMCLSLNEKRTPLNQEQSQFRQDIIRDGEQLLSDLSSIQMSYMEDMSQTESIEIIPTKTIHRRHSYAAGNNNFIYLMNESFSFASQLEQDCMSKLTSVIPTLRSITL